jgi:hypothetical protein
MGPQQHLRKSEENCMTGFMLRLRFHILAAAFLFSFNITIVLSCFPVALFGPEIRRACLVESFTEFR